MQCAIVDVRKWFTPEVLASVLAARDVARPVKVSGVSATGLEGPDTAGLDYRVLDGTAVKRELPGLHALSTDPELVGWLSDRSGAELVPRTSHATAGANINYVEGMGKRYEWHVDSVHWTLLVFVTTHGFEEGGALCMNDVANVRGKPVDYAYMTATRIQPRAGYGLLFRGSATPHAVEPLKKDVLRVTIPIEFDEKGAPPPPVIEDPSYLYGDKM